MHIRNLICICVEWRTFPHVLPDLAPRIPSCPKARTLTSMRWFSAFRTETMASLSRRCGGGPIFCHKTQTKRVALKGLTRLFYSNHRSCRRLFFWRKCRWFSLLYSPRAYLTWRDTVLPDPHSLPLPPQAHSIVYLLSGFMVVVVVGGGYVELSAAVCSSSCKKNTSALHPVRRKPRTAKQPPHFLKLKYFVCLSLKG